MKRFLGIALAAFLVIGLAGPAAAYFEKGNLMQAIYTDETSKQIVTDAGADTFGNVYDVLGGLDYGTSTLIHDAWVEPVEIAPGFEFDYDYRQAEASNYYWANYNVGMWASYNTNQGFFTATSDQLDNVNLTAKGSFEGNSDVVQGYIRAVTADPTDPNYESDKYDTSGTTSTAGYDFKMNSGQTATGFYGGLNPIYDSNFVGEANMAVFDATGEQTLDLFLYNMGTWTDGPMAKLSLVEQTDGTLDLYGVKLSEVPVPGAVLLFGTGLLGFFGLRRKNQA